MPVYAQQQRWQRAMPCLPAIYNNNMLRNLVLPCWHLPSLPTPGLLPHHHATNTTHRFYARLVACTHARTLSCRAAAAASVFCRLRLLLYGPYTATCCTHARARTRTHTLLLHRTLLRPCCGTRMRIRMRFAGLVVIVVDGPNIVLYGVRFDDLLDVQGSFARAR